MAIKSVLITGCSSGIGLETSMFLKGRGFEVFPTARKPDDVKHLINLGFDDACRLDLENSASIKETVSIILSKTQGTLYALVNNAGYGLTCAVEDLTRDALRRQFETNLFGLQELTNLIIPVFRRQGFGRIINVSSVVGRLALPYMGGYCASKFALEAMSDALRIELADTNIYVSIVEPGNIKTNFTVNASKYFDDLSNKNASPHAKAYNIIDKDRKDENKQNRKFPAIAVSKKILHALESKRPRARYLIAPEAYFAAIIKKIIPDSAIDFFMAGHLKSRGYK